MSPPELLLAAIVVLAIVGGLLSWLARRLDALHKRVINSRAVLDAQLVRRAELAMELAVSGALDEASTLIVADAAWLAGVQAQRLVGADPSIEAATLGELAAMTTAGGSDRGAAETNLTIALRGSLGDADDRAELEEHAPETAVTLNDLQNTVYRVQLAHRFHNEAVDAAHRLRRAWLVRTFRLAGRAALPEHFVMDDAVIADLE